MAYPTDLPTLTNPLAADARVGHALLHSDVNDAVEALAAKVGIGNDTPTSVGDVLTVTSSGVTAWSAPSGGGTPGVDYPTPAIVTLSSADILDLHNTPVTLVAAPGAGKYLMPHAIVVWVGYVTTPYTVSDDLSIRYVTGDDISLDAATAAVFNFSGFRKLLLLDDIAGDDGIVNKGIEMYVRAGALTGGDGTLTVTVWYTEESVP